MTKEEIKKQHICVSCKHMKDCNSAIDTTGAILQCPSYEKEERGQG